jgi:hypothetical protein
MDDFLAPPAFAPGTGLDAALLPPEAPLALGPGSGWDDDDYREAEKPRVREVKDAADDLLTDHSLRLGQAREYSHFLDGSDPGYFVEDEELISQDIVEKMPLLGEREAYEFRCGWLAMHDPYPRLLNRDALDESEAIAVEDLVVYDFQCEERQYARQYGGDLRWDEAAHLLRFGMLVGLDTLDPERPEVGLDMRLIDPLTVFFEPGGSYGPPEVYRVYEASNEEIIGAYGGRPGSAESERIRRKVKDTATKTKKGRRSVMVRDELRTVTECWNRDWLQVVLDEDVDLLSRKHGYRRLPFTIRVGGFDQPPGVSIGSSTRADAYVQRSRWGPGGEVTVSGRSLDLARMMRPYGYRQVWAHRIAEAVAGRRLSMFKWAIDPHTVLEYDPATEHKMGDTTDLLPGEQTRIPLPNRLNIVTPAVDPNVMAGLAADLQANVGSGFLTQMRLGAIPPQTSGSALGKMAALGGAAETVLVRALQSFKRDRAEWRLELRRDFGDAIGQPLGLFRFPGRAEGGRTPLHEVTPEILRRAGVQVDIELHAWEPDVALAQYLSTLRNPSPVTGKPLISDATARRKLKATPDADREGHRIDDEALAALPPVQQQRHLLRLEQEMDDAMERGDAEDVQRLMVAIAELEFLHDMAIAAGAASPAGGGGGMNGGGMGVPAPMPAAPTGGGGPALPGNSLPELGIGVGTEGGRPSGGAAPQAMTPVGGARSNGRSF